MRWRILLYNGFDELDAIAPFEVLSMAARRLAASADPPAPPWSVALESLDGAAEVRASNGLIVRLDPPARSTTLEALVIPGGGWVDRSRAGARTEFERGDGPGTVAAAIRDAHRSGVLLASVCTGAMLLARAGLLRGRRCITHHAAIDDLRREGAVIVPSRVVDDGDIVTAGGVTSGIDLALHLVRRFGGESLAAGIARTLEYEPMAAISGPRS